MTISLSTNAPRVAYTVAQGVVQTVFAVPFEFFDDEDVTIYLDGTAKTLGSDYTLTGGNGAVGTLTFVTTGGTQLITGAAGGSTVIIVRDVELSRVTDFATSGDINRVALNLQLDTLVAQISDMDDRLSRTIQLNDYEVAPSMLLTADRKDKILAFNASTGNVEAGPSISAVNTAVTALSTTTTKANEAAASAATASAQGTIATNKAALATTAVTNAQTAETNAETAETNAATSSTNSGNSATASANSATASSNSASTASTQATNASNSATAASNSATAASNSATGANSSATTATTKASEASTSATNAATAKTNAETAETNAETAETNAAASASTASTHASTATTKASEASTSATNAATSATNSSSSASAASSSASTATTKASEASTSAASALTNKNATDVAKAAALVAEANAETAETNAETAETNAETAEANAVTAKNAAVVAKDAAVTAKTAAETAETNAETAETNAASSASTATTRANTATAQATISTDKAAIATTKASEAASSASTAATAETGAVTAKDAALAALDSFDDRYLGQKSSNPSVDNDGNTLVAGALYFNTTDDTMKVYEGSTWVAAYASLSGAVLQTGSAMTGDLTFGDNDKAMFGAGSDLQIYHDGSMSIISDSGTGELRLDSTTGLGVWITSGGGAEAMAKFKNNGAVELYYNDASKFATTSTGIQVTGNIANASGDFTLDVAGNLSLDADGGSVFFKDAGTEFFKIRNTGSDVQIYSARSDADIKFEGVDGGVGITALTLDMSAAGAATFNGRITADAGIDIDNIIIDGSTITSNTHLNLDIVGDLIIDVDGAEVKLADGGVTFGTLYQSSSNFCIQSNVSDKDMLFQGNDGGTGFTALTLDMSDAGTATFNHDIKLNDNGQILFGSSYNGTIGTASGDLFLGTADANILFFNSASVLPANSAGGTRDNAIDLGGSSTRFKDLHLSGNVVVSGTVDSVDVAARDAVLTSTTTTAGAALPKSGGAMTGAITTNSTFDGRDVATDGTKLDGVATSANNYTHPTGAGNNHIPSGGSANQYLKYSSSGTAVWATVSSTPASLSTASGSAPSYSARAFVNYNGTTNGIRASGNHSSVTDNGAGKHTPNMSTALASTNFTVTTDTIGYNANDTNQYAFLRHNGSSPSQGSVNFTTTSYQIATGDGGSIRDSVYVGAMVML